VNTNPDPTAADNSNPNNHWAPTVCVDERPALHASFAIRGQESIAHLWLVPRRKK
jgi:hypothetical protein